MQPLVVGEQLVDPLAEALDVPRWHQQEAPAGGGDLLRARLTAAADGGHPGGHRLDVGRPERLLGGGHHEHARAARLLQRGGRIELTVEVHPLGHPQPRGQGLRGRGARGRRRRSSSAASGVAVEHRQRPQHVGVALAGHQVGDGHQRGRPRGPACGRAVVVVARAGSARRWQLRAEVDYPRAGGAHGLGRARRCRGCWRARAGRPRVRAPPHARREVRARPCRGRPRRARRRSAACAGRRGGRRPRPARHCGRGSARRGTSSAAAAARTPARAPPRRPSPGIPARAAARHRARRSPPARRATGGGARPASPAASTRPARPRPRAPPAGARSGAARSRARRHRLRGQRAPGGGPRSRSRDPGGSDRTPPRSRPAGRGPFAHQWRPSSLTSGGASSGCGRPRGRAGGAAPTRKARASASAASRP